MSDSKKPVGFVIPAFNEGERICQVIEILLALPEPFRPAHRSLVVIDDCSSDDTKKKAEGLGVWVIRSGQNYGKGSSMGCGFDVLQHNHRAICFLDADLVHLTVEQVIELISPVVSGEAQATMGIFASGRATTTWAQKLAPALSGQRCVSTELLCHFDHDDWNCRFGIETALNTFLRAFAVENRRVEWHGTTHVMKEEKSGFWGGLVARLRMFYDIVVAKFHTRKMLARYQAKYAVILCASQA